MFNSNKIKAIKINHSCKTIYRAEREGGGGGKGEINRFYFVKAKQNYKVLRTRYTNEL